MQEIFSSIWEKQQGFTTSDSPCQASQMPKDTGYSVGTGKRWVPATLKFSDSEVHAEHREQQITSSNRGKWKRTFCHV